MKIYEFNYMKLNNIIKNYKVKVKAMKLLRLIFTDKKWEKYKDKIITDEDVYKQYNNYIKFPIFKKGITLILVKLSIFLKNNINYY